MRIAIFLTLMTVASLANAKETISFNDGAKLDLEKGQLTLSVEGKNTWTFELKEADPKENGRLSLYIINDDMAVVHAATGPDRGKASEAVFIRRGTKQTMKPIWQEITGLKGDVGEQIGKVVRFQDLTGDGVVEIVTGYISESVRICGKKELPLLFRKVYDFKSKRFKSVLAKRPGLDDAKEVLGSQDAGGLATEPLVNQVAANAASRIAGDQSEPILLAPPGGIVDQNAETAWVPVPSNGAGEFATLDVMSDSYGVTRVGIRPMVEGASPREYDRPKTIFLTTSSKTYKLVFKEDPASSPDKTFWFDLGTPDHTSCLSLVIESSFAPSKRKSMAITEITVLTEVDEPGGLTILSKDLLNSKKRRQAGLLLERAGAKALPPLRSVWNELDWQGKQRAVSVIATSAPKDGADLLVRALIAGDPEIAPTARRGLMAAGESAVEHLTEYLKSDVHSQFTIAVDVLASLSGSLALTTLASIAGKGDRKRRAHLRARLGLLSRKNPLGNPSMAETLWTQVETFNSRGDMEGTLDLLRSAVGIPSLTKRIRALVINLYEQSDNFADRYRLLDIMGELGCVAPFEHLAQSAKSRDRHIRTIAIKGLGACRDDDPKRQSLLVEALADERPEVRLVTLRVMLSSGTSNIAADQIGSLATKDPWPDIRASGVSNTRHLDSKTATDVLTKTQNDPSSRVRMATIEAAIPIPGERIDQIIEDRLRSDSEKPMAKKTAAFAAGIRCQKSALPLLFEVLKKGAEPLAAEKDIAVAEAAARAMGDIGTEEALELLKKARRRSNPATDKAIDNAVRSAPGRCVSKEKKK